MDLFVAEVTQSTNRRADARIDVARGIANDLGKLAKVARQLMQACPDPRGLSGPVAAKHLRLHRGCGQSMAGFRDHLSPFMNEHEALLGSRVRETLNEFVEWSPRYQEALERRVRTFKRDFAKDMAEDRERLRELNSEWDITTADGVSA